MISVILALVPLLFATGFLTWTMTMGAREQARSDAWARDWVEANAAAKRKHRSAARNPPARCSSGLFSLPRRNVGRLRVLSSRRAP